MRRPRIVHAGQIRSGLSGTATSDGVQPIDQVSGSAYICAGLLLKEFGFAERFRMGHPAMTSVEIEERIQEMVRRIVAGFDPDSIILFGSHARGNPGPDSDVDLLVVKPIEGSKREERVRIGAVLHGMGIAKDVVVATPEDIQRRGTLVGTVLRPALIEGKVLYERTVAQI
jgi:uncharacterized protein